MLAKPRLGIQPRVWYLIADRSKTGTFVLYYDPWYRSHFRLCETLVSFNFLPSVTPVAHDKIKFPQFTLYYWGTQWYIYIYRAIYRRYFFSNATSSLCQRKKIFRWRHTCNDTVFGPVRQDTVPL